MSIIHVNQIKNTVTKTFDGLIDLTDCANAPRDQKEAFSLTRALAAYAILHLSGTTPDLAATAVTDGGDDNGIDAVFYDEPNRQLYLVQSKWIRDGSGEPDNGEVKKFVSGVHDLFNMLFERFNAKVRTKAAEVTKALNDPHTRYQVVLAHTGVNRLASHSERDLSDLGSEMNDTSEVVFITVLYQANLHASLAAGVTGEPISLEISLRAWGRKEEPQEAFYGQLSGDQVAVWWATHRTRLFASNLRGMLGETDVNAEMRETLEHRPEEFWYFNNGITIVAATASKTMAGGASHDLATLHCEDISIVNGAQTVGTIGKFAEAHPEKVNQVFIPARIIVRGTNAGFGEDVTRTNNRQNKIENRDFAVLDPEQARLRRELAIEGIDYQLVRAETVTKSETAFDLVEATTALACASRTVRLPVQLKREIGRLWDDITKAPYKELFNASVPGLFVWRCVRVQRRIDAALDTRHKRGGTTHPKRYAVSTHGNRLIAALIFEELPVERFKNPELDIETVASEGPITTLVDSKLDALITQLDKHYSGSIIPTLFKNLKKCEHLAKKVRTISARAATQLP